MGICCKGTETRMKLPMLFLIVVLALSCYLYWIVQHDTEYHILNVVKYGAPFCYVSDDVIDAERETISKTSIDTRVPGPAIYWSWNPYTDPHGTYHPICRQGLDYSYITEQILSDRYYISRGGMPDTVEYEIAMLRDPLPLPTEFILGFWPMDYHVIGYGKFESDEFIHWFRLQTDGNIFLLYGCCSSKIGISPKEKFTAYTDIIHDVNLSEGSSTPECMDDSSCFVPNIMTINLGDTVTFHNIDSSQHTVAHGTTDKGPGNMFASGIMNPGDEFSHEFELVGEHDYFCVIHPWATGKIVVK